MIGKKLKKYDEYLKRLILFAYALDIRVEFTESTDNGCYVPRKRLILISDDLPHSNTIASLLHELGHVLDDIFLEEYLSNTELDDAYKKTYAGKHNKKELSLVILCEMRAWKTGRAIAERLRIPLGKDYDRLEKACLSDYNSK